jgi:prepilin-type N-terminal cleavage/methylation domain-containing protein
MKGKGFTLVELILVVAILGILGALVMPVYQGHATEAKTSSAKTNLHILRAQIELYRLQHKGSTPGYINGAAFAIDTVVNQLTKVTAEGGQVGPGVIPVGPCQLGPYLKKIPENPFNKDDSMIQVAVGTNFALAADGISSGWLYKIETAEIRLNWPGTDEEGVAYVDY